MSGIGNVLGLFQKDPKFRTLRNVKNPEIGDRITSLLGDWDTTRTGGQNALADYITKRLAGESDARARTAQETGVIDQFYNGGMASQLAGLRARQEAAVNDAAKVGALQAIRNANLSRLGGSGSGSSYEQRMMSGMLSPIYTQAALQKAGQERSDLDYLTGNQLGLAGRRQSMADALSEYNLAPDRLRRQMLLGDVQGLSGLTNLDQANSFYGLQQKTTDLDRWQNFLNSGALESMVGSVAGLAGAGGAKGGGGGSL